MLAVHLVSKSNLKKLLATVLISLALILLYETTIRDLDNAPGLPEEPDIVTGAWLPFSATAYCFQVFEFVVVWPLPILGSFLSVVWSV